MFLEPMPGMRITAVGGSHYMGDLYIDLETMLVRRATMAEFVVSQVQMPEPQGAINGVTERALVIEALSAEEFERERGVAP